MCSKHMDGPAAGPSDKQTDEQADEQAGGRTNIGGATCQSPFYDVGNKNKTKNLPHLLRSMP